MLLTLLQLNTWHGGKLFQPMTECIRVMNADILHLQEVISSPDGVVDHAHPNYRLLEYLRDKLGYSHVAFSKSFDFTVEDGRVLSMGVGTFSRFHIAAFHNEMIAGHDGPRYEHYSEELKMDFTRSPAQFVTAVIDVNGKKLTSINMHGVWGFDGEDNERRFAMRDALIAEISASPYPVVCSGDFNTSPHTQTMKDIGKYLHNVFGDELRTTFNAKRWKKADAEYVVDYCFISPDLKTISHKQPQLDISDHLPMIIQLEIT